MDTSTDSLRGFRRYIFWSLVGTPLLVLLLPAITGPVPLPPDPLGSVSLAGVFIVVVAAARLIEQHIPPTAGAPPLPSGQRRVWAFVGGAASLTVATTAVIAGDDILWAFAPALVVSLLLADLPARPRWIAVAVAIGVTAAAGVTIGLLRGDDPLTAFPLSGAVVSAFAIFMSLATIWTWDVVAQLDSARQAAARLAVANERLRFAADLHDIQGHHLQVIALKGELAARVLRTDPDAAEREMSAVQELAAEALRDTRAVVQGYRRTTLDAEIANATTVLGSAGIDARLRLDPGLRTDTLPETGRHLLGLVLREAVTNIVRHSTATRADVTLSGGEHVELAVANDGADHGFDHEAAARAGGLDDLAERLGAAGGGLSWHRTGSRFEVRAELPAAPGGQA